uniref:glutathione transferase n=1 Tax=Zonotrichia albicollis TaxID=44394 RepID=A0A8D2MGX0_ZONAL
MGLGSLWPCRAAESCSSGNAGGKGCCATPGSDWIQGGMLGSSPGRSISPGDAGMGSAMQGHSLAMDSRDLLEGGLGVGEIKKKLSHEQQRTAPALTDGDRTPSNQILTTQDSGETEEEILRVDMLENQIMDFRMSLVMVCYNPDFEKLKPGYLEQLPGKLKLFSNFLGDRKWFAGEKLTFVDFLMFDVLDQNRIFEPKCLEPFKNLKDFVERFGALEKVAAYLKSSRFQKMPINNKMAKWGNKKV